MPRAEHPGMPAGYRVERVTPYRKGWRVRTLVRDRHYVQLQCPPGPRRRGGCIVHKIGHPPTEKNPCTFAHEFAMNPEIGIVLPNPLKASRMWYQMGHKLIADAVYEIKYRHADDGLDYVHKFEKPENVRIVVESPYRALLLGLGEPIVEEM